MRIISNKALLDFSTKHPLAHSPLQKWRRTIESRSFANFSDIKSAFHATDKARSYHIFNVGGNRYRIIAEIDYPRQKLFIRHVFTHQEYSKWKP